MVADPSEPTVKLVHIAKQRNGPTAKIRLLYLPQTMAFDTVPVGQKSYGVTEAASA